MITEFNVEETKQLQKSKEESQRVIYQDESVSMEKHQKFSKKAKGRNNNESHQSAETHRSGQELANFQVNSGRTESPKKPENKYRSDEIEIKQSKDL